MTKWAITPDSPVFRFLWWLGWNSYMYIVYHALNASSVNLFFILTPFRWLWTNQNSNVFSKCASQSKLWKLLLLGKFVNFFLTNKLEEQSVGKDWSGIVSPFSLFKQLNHPNFPSSMFSPTLTFNIGGLSDAIASLAAAPVRLSVTQSLTLSVFHSVWCPWTHTHPPIHLPDHEICTLFTTCLMWTLILNSVSSLPQKFVHNPSELNYTDASIPCIASNRQVGNISSFY